MQQVSKSLRPGGVFAFDLGPSIFDFNIKISDHRSGIVNSDEVMTELSHPLYQTKHDAVLKLVRAQYPDFNRENLWSPTSTKIGIDYISEECEKVGLGTIEVKEDLSPIPRSRIINFIKNG